MSDEQLQLVPRPVPPSLVGIDLRCCDVSEVLAEVRGADLVVADAPWLYQNNSGRSGFKAAESHYQCLRMPDILAHVDDAFDCAADDAYLLLWATWPTLDEWMTAVHLGASRAAPWFRWRYLTAGAWTKTGAPGIGFHWRGNSEPLLVYAKGKPRPNAGILNAFSSARAAHSEKPLAWARDHVRAFCPPGGLVLDLYAGRAPYARAAHLESRMYVGAEISPERHADALGLLAGVRP